MNPEAVIESADIRKLMGEIDRYLAAVDLFRAEGHEPAWRSEIAAGVSLERSLSERQDDRVVH